MTATATIERYVHSDDEPCEIMAMLLNDAESRTYSISFNNARKFRITVTVEEVP